MSSKEMYSRALEMGWEVETTSLYDEEGVEGWLWTSPEGNEYSVVGEWNETPPLPEFLYQTFSEEVNNG